MVVAVVVVSSGSSASRRSRGRFRHCRPWLSGPPRQPGRQSLPICTSTEYLLKAGEVDLPASCFWSQGLRVRAKTRQEHGSWHDRPAHGEFLLSMPIWRLLEGTLTQGCLMRASIPSRAKLLSSCAACASSMSPSS